MDKKKIAKFVGIGVAALLIGLSQLGLFPDLGFSHSILEAIGFSQDAAPTAPTAPTEAK